MHKIESFDNIVKKKIPVPGTVTAYADSKNTEYKAYGMSNGVIFLVDKDGNTQRLIGHRSRISRLKLNGKRIFSASYDGTIKLWIADSGKPEPISLYSNNSWLMNFTFDQSKTNVWMVDQSGHLAEFLMSVPMMADKLYNMLRRDLTPSEWDYYIGKNIPYESFVKPIRKEVRE